jgi:hypothetical protein
MVERAIASAETEHVVYFLLTAWLEARAHAECDARLPDELARLPVRGEAEVQRRLRTARKCAAEARDAKRAQSLEQAADILRAATVRLSALSVRASRSMPQSASFHQSSRSPPADPAVRRRVYG